MLSVVVLGEFKSDGAYNESIQKIRALSNDLFLAKISDDFWNFLQLKSTHVQKTINICK